MRASPAAHITILDAKNEHHSPWTDSPHTSHLQAVRNDDLMTLGDRIRVARKMKGWSQEDLAARAALDRSYVGGIERGERNITITTLMSICHALDCNASDLLDKLPSN